MAAVTASYNMSKISCAKYGGTLVWDTRAFQNSKMPCLRRGTVSYHGLRSRNLVDSIQLRAKKAKGSARQAKRGSNSRPCAVIVCGSGMK
ncbi:granule-bound starch synthase 1b, chloroplastic/amyloplastic isoform X1 [Iris pallida]|uniref:Granule-bound starch synthase 1b, chloroplastic/amyloplastic isoform X1 n=1 Tax=Iris pallida TaxID=29817 RepID=A0AAX6GKX4_IRIPA|nr:granule-bound starch synthase 1b, chloroplastic/amyloplastic isoform X2 [Iris pallida]KAJ6829433.1 granule-bound starch synthase 1b, chloroplastic/amyloplastic isoform X1 [Iris pallida]